MNLFILTAPYQILNALEAIEHFSLENNHLVVIDVGLFPEQKILSLFDEKIWTSTRLLRFHSGSGDRDFGTEPPKTLSEWAFEKMLRFDQLVMRRKADRLAKDVGPVSRLFLGGYLRDYDQFLRHFANIISAREVVILDAGTDALRVARHRLEEIENGEVPGDGRVDVDVVSLKARFRRRFVDWHSQGVPRLTFFSTYNFDTGADDRLVRHSYECLTSRRLSHDVGNEVWFLGQDLADQHYVEMEVYRKYAGKIMDHFAGSEIIYVPHPAESERQIDVVSNCGFVVRQFDTPIEYTLCFGETRPRCIASFTSSALPNCYAIFGTQIALEAVCIAQQDLLKDHDVIAAIYEQFVVESNGHINVVGFDATSP